MSTLSWNCHGIGTPWAIQFLKELILQKNPNFIFLSETLCKKEKAERIRDMIGFEGVFTVEAQGHNGGLVLFWRNKDEVTVQSFSRNHIDVLIEDQVGYNID